MGSRPSCASADKDDQRPLHEAEYRHIIIENATFLFDAIVFSEGSSDARGVVRGELPSCNTLLSSAVLALHGVLHRLMACGMY